jgi:hypothetical protein
MGLSFPTPWRNFWRRRRRGERGKEDARYEKAVLTVRIKTRTARDKSFH